MSAPFRPAHPMTGVSNPVLVVHREVLEGVLASVMVAYENAVAGADTGAFDFEPFDTLPIAIGTLRATLAEPDLTPGETR